MTWNPYLNGLAASAYIWGLVFLINHIARLHHDTPDNLVGTAAALSLFTFTGVVLATLFFYRPVSLLIESKPKEAISFLLKTLGTFGILTILVILTIV